MIYSLLIKIIYLIVIFFQYIAPYIFKNSVLLACIILLIIIMLVQWYLYKSNVFIMIENHLENYNYTFKNGYAKSSFVYEFEKIFNANDMAIFYLMILIPAINMWICLDKILNNCGIQE